MINCSWPGALPGQARGQEVHRERVFLITIRATEEKQSAYLQRAFSTHIKENLRRIGTNLINLCTLSDKNKGT